MLGTFHYPSDDFLVFLNSISLPHTQKVNNRGEFISQTVKHSLLADTIDVGL